MKNVSLLMGLLVLDQSTKWWAFLGLKTSPVILVPYWLELQYHQNFGVGFSIMVPQVLVEIITFFIVGFGLLFLYTKRPKKIISVAVVLVLAGAMGNLIDRVRLDYVIDFVSHGFWPVYNFADVYITLGLGIWILSDLLAPKKLD